MNDKFVAGLVTALAIGPLCAVCVLGPLAFGSVAMGVAGWLGGAGLVLTIGLLAIAGLLAWRSIHRRGSRPQGNTCEPGFTETGSAAGKRTTKQVLTKTFMFVGVLAVLGSWVPMARAAEQTVVLKVDMWCSSCSYIIKRSLMDVHGVTAVTTSYEKQVAVVQFDDEQTTISTLTRTTAELGFPSTVLPPDGN